MHILERSWQLTVSLTRPDVLVLFLGESSTSSASLQRLLYISYKGTLAFSELRAYLVFSCMYWINCRWGWLDTTYWVIRFQAIE